MTRRAIAVVLAACSTSSAEPDASAPLDASPVDAPFEAAVEAEADAAAPAFYGPGIGADSLDNHQVATTDVDFRFRAAATSTIASLRWYDIYTIKCAPHSTVDAGTCPNDCAPSGSVYACGTGGDMHICIETDDGTSAHLATGTTLACVNHPSASGPPDFPLETFPSPASVTAGTLYHVHWHNTNATPSVNFTSVDTLYVDDATVPRQPVVDDTDLAVFRGTTLRTQDTPIYELRYGDGTVQGQGYIESWIGAPESISGASAVRETFTPSADHAVHAASVRVTHVSGASALVLVLEQGDGTVIDQASVPAFPIGKEPAWVTGTFTSSPVLANGKAYDLVLTAPSDSVYAAYGLERGNDYGFAPPSFFADGFGQFSIDDGGAWTGFTQPGGSTNNDNADVQFYFE